ncbi:hypothetical protein CesoFtcFv8_025943 [Champsocephalus esox]|uniref:Uncharacterized protein n=1 Tax=Champsocephalus esox TaxID=159716 RepID=A0AAN8GBE4_9TELE|nr:hypothetical protein CesoFtcFv8_025943 [Champsocephalus esox]
MRNSAEEIEQICPVLFLTPSILRVDECFPAPQTLEMEEIGRRIKSTRATDNEIWPGLDKNKIRPASHLCPAISLSGSDEEEDLSVHIRTYRNKLDWTHAHHCKAPYSRTK